MTVGWFTFVLDKGRKAKENLSNLLIFIKLIRSIKQTNNIELTKKLKNETIWLFISLSEN